ncbi:SGNH/GDSL hydrolase family protein [Actinoplanes sp. NPDC051633]|uniref:SGNH/GDSL hydrolase family protein n=1 Tax=Actinoplanes sp. NPDC051633 TaxID=3155670 RepID=UPI00344A8FF6
MRRTTALVSLALSAVLTLVTATPAAAASRIDYIALGDSYSSGVGASGQIGLCLRSSNAYPGLWAAANHPKSYRSVACGGATTDDVRRFQLGALSRGTDLVSITIGGNDVGFASTMITCTLVSEAGCQAAVDDAVETGETVLPGKLDSLYAGIAGRAPNARVLVLGYPLLFDETAPSCGFAGLSVAKRRAINQGDRELNAVIADRASAAGFEFVDVTDDFAGHGACSAQPWINGLVILPPTNSFHPNGSGYRYGYLPALSDAVG